MGIPHVLQTGAFFPDAVILKLVEGVEIDGNRGVGDDRIDGEAEIEGDTVVSVDGESGKSLAARDTSGVDGVLRALCCFGCFCLFSACP